MLLLYEDGQNFISSTVKMKNIKSEVYCYVCSSRELSTQYNRLELKSIDENRQVSHEDVVYIHNGRVHSYKEWWNVLHCNMNVAQWYVKWSKSKEERLIRIISLIYGI